MTAAHTTVQRTESAEVPEHAPGRSATSPAPRGAPSTRSPLALRFWRLYSRWRVQRSLAGVFVSGLDTVRAKLAEGPVILASTHVSWWDGLIMVLLDEALRAEGHVVVEATTMNRMPWLRGIGAIPLDRSGGASARAGLRAAASVLDRPGRLVWIFPQGRQRPAWLRPLDLQPGVALLARMAHAPIIPVALTYAFREDPAPAAIVHFGDPVPPDQLEPALIAGLASIDRFLEPGAPGLGQGAPPPATPPVATREESLTNAVYTVLIAPPGTRAEEGFWARLLARFTGRS